MSVTERAMCELDILYSPSFWSKRSSPEEIIEHHMKFTETASQSTRKKIPCKLDISYGQRDREKYDLFGTDLNDDAPIFVFVHGGYWQMKELSRKSYEFIANSLHKHGIKSIFMGYELCPDVSLPEMIDEIRSATRECINYALRIGSRGLSFCGHSAGAHLVASLFTDFVQELPQEMQSIMKAAILISGLFDLLPVQKTEYNEPLKLNESEAFALSPSKRKISDGVGTEFYVIVGENESPEFIKQTEEFSDKLKSSGLCAHLTVVPKVDHFEIIELLSKDDFSLTNDIVSICQR